MSFKLVKQSDSDKGSQIFKGLNSEQIKAVSVIDGPMLIIAGAGSGKTRVLTHRIAYMIENGISPNNILALTFTNKAAKEMKERIANLVSPEVASRIWAGTFHSIFARILRYEATSIGYEQNFSIYDQDDSLSLIKTAMNQIGINIQQVNPNAVRSKISDAKNKVISWQEFSAQADETFTKQVGQIYEAYQKSLLLANSMDFDDLLVNIIHVFQNSADTLDKYQERFKYILIDEYQDTNHAQYTALKLLSGKYNNISVVGDDAQSIYRWRGADIRNILGFRKDYSEVVEVRLEQNYRSTKTILGAADSIIKNNRQQLTKTLWTDNPDGELIEVLDCWDDKEEAQKIVDTINSMISGGQKQAKDFAVLYRTNAQSLALENAFRRANLHYVIIGGMSFYKRKEIKDALAYIRLLINNKDNEALSRIVNEPPRGIGPTSIKHLLAFAGEKQISLLTAYARADENEDLQPRAKNAANDFVRLIKKFSDQIGTADKGSLIERYIDETGLLQLYKQMDTSETLDRWNNVKQLLQDIKEFFAKNPDSALDEYMQQISLITDIDEKDTTQNQVKLMTLHTAKGLEFPVVIISGLEHGLFPLAKAEQHSEEMEEERRLFYVGITRAEERLYLSYATRRLRFGDYSDQSPSKFLREINPKYLKTRLDGIGREKPKPAYKPQGLSYYSDAPSQDYYTQLTPSPARKVLEKKTSINVPSGNGAGFYQIGMKVSHQKFGPGKILALSGSGNNAKAVVDFASVGKKVLMLEFAKLEKL